MPVMLPQSTVFIFFLAFCGELALLVSCNPEPGKQTPLCTEVHGFADEYNADLHIPIPIAPGANESFVLAVQAFPLGQMSIPQPLLQLNATYLLEAGTVVSRTSDADGILQLTWLAANTAVSVHIKGVRNSEPVAFRFVSYHANRPSCRFKVSPQSDFCAPMPVSVLSGGSITPAVAYYNVSVPLTVSAVIVTFYGKGGAPANGVYDVLSDSDAVTGVSHASGELVKVTPGTFFLFAYAPLISRADNGIDKSPPYTLLCVSVRWGEWTQRGQDKLTTAVNSEIPGQGASPSTIKESSTFGFGRLLILILFLLVAYVVVRSYYNWSVLGKHEFPEMVPHVDYCYAGVRFFSIALSRLTGGRIERTDYNTIDRTEMMNSYDY